jgi:hypothetical protein
MTSYGPIKNGNTVPVSTVQHVIARKEDNITMDYCDSDCDCDSGSIADSKPGSDTMGDSLCSDDSDWEDPQEN